MAIAVVISENLNPEKRLFDEANALDAEGNYAAAVDKYQQLLATYPNGKYWYDALTAKLDSYHSYVSQLIEEQKYDEATTKWFAVRNEYAGYWICPNNDTILSAIPADTLLTEANQMQTKNVTLALRLYDIILVYYPDSPSAVEAQNATIAIEIQQLKEGKGNRISPWNTETAELGGKVEVVIINDSPEAMTILLSGPNESKKLTIAASPNSSYHSSFGSLLHPDSYSEPPNDAERATLTLTPGFYSIIIRSNSADALFTSETFAGNNRYQYWIYIQRTVLVP